MSKRELSTALFKTILLEVNVVQDNVSIDEIGKEADKLAERLWRISAQTGR